MRLRGAFCVPLNFSCNLALKLFNRNAKVRFRLAANVGPSYYFQDHGNSLGRVCPSGRFSPIEAQKANTFHVFEIAVADTSFRADSLWPPVELPAVEAFVNRRFSVHVFSTRRLRRRFAHSLVVA